MRLKQNKKKIELLKLSNVLKRAAKEKQSELDNILKKKEMPRRKNVFCCALCFECIQACIFLGKLKNK